MGISAESSRYTAFNTCFGTYKFLRLPMGLKTAPNTFQLLMDKAPQNIKQLRRTIGLFNWFKKFIPNFSAIISPLTKLLKKNQKFEWKIEQSTAFQNLKTHLVNTDNLSFPRFDLPFILAVDTSSKGIGYMLYQKDPTKEKPNIIRFGSKSLSRWQQSYGPTKLELLGMVTSILDCADYLRGTQFIVECDHQALQPLFMKQFKGAIYERWLAILQQFTFEIQYKPAEQMKVADALSQDAIDIVADKHIDLYSVETDEHDSLNDPYDADTDESDSYVHNRKKKFGRNNQNVEQLANTLRDFQVGANTSNIKKLQRKDSDLKKIIAYLEDDVLPDSQKESRRILLESCDFILVDDVLYHRRKAKSERTKNMSEFQLVIPKQLISQILKITHDSPLGGHSGIQNTLDSVRERYYFARMGKIISEYVQSCHECQSRKVSNLKTKAKIVALSYS
ncbi:Hypothetical predicted protein [Mytilus galloprovincialis]|uniref:Reverse transcriptase/retrotransposon-derived protein RNase H-like domain-containing protein n=1 Tax=Mytilus galloprovincialis TaxID=29158 RepID=A0A8B6BSE0_MYTGA|nr:Hypothetical predicted protein [Mytilus galloprovincialis]